MLNSKFVKRWRICTISHFLNWQWPGQYAFITHSFKYSEIPIKRGQFSPKSSNQHSIVQMWRPDMRLFFRFKLVIYVLPQSLVCCMYYFGPHYNSTGLYTELGGGIESVSTSKTDDCPIRTNMVVFGHFGLISDNVLSYLGDNGDTFL